MTPRSPQENGLRDRQAERVSGLHIDDQIELCGPLHGQVVERNTFNSRLSVVDGDNVRLDLGVHGPPPESLGDRFGRDVGGFAEQRGVARLDLVS